MVLSKVALSYRYDIAAVMVFQNEAPYLKEWIEYHKLIGVEHFYLYNNGSLDDYQEVLKPYIQKGEVELFDRAPVDDIVSFDHLQRAIYTDALELSRRDVKWLLIIDADEFIVPVRDQSLKKFLQRYEDNKTGGVYLSWIWFGTSFIPQIPDNTLLIEALHLNKGPTNEGKSIVRPQRVERIVTPHRHSYKQGYHCKTIATSEAQINHYWCRDEHFAYAVKWPRRAKWGMTPAEFEIWLNDGNRENPEYYKPILKYVEPLRKRVFK